MHVQVCAPPADGDVGHLMTELSKDFGNLKLEFDRLLGSLSTSVHDATKLTLEHTTLYDTAVGELQVRRLSEQRYFTTLLYLVPKVKQLPVRSHLVAHQRRCAGSHAILHPLSYHHPMPA